MHCTAPCMQSPASIHLQMTRTPLRETNKYTYVSSNMYAHIKNTARPPKGKSLLVSKSIAVFVPFFYTGNKFNFVPFTKV